MSKSEKTRMVIERYCPIVCRNVAVETTSEIDGQTQHTCLELHSCVNEHGGCKNRYLCAEQPK
jgi:hypothetical protein